MSYDIAIIPALVLIAFVYGYLRGSHEWAESFMEILEERNALWDRLHPHGSHEAFHVIRGRRNDRHG